MIFCRPLRSVCSAYCVITRVFYINAKQRSGIRLALCVTGFASEM